MMNCNIILELRREDSMKFFMTPWGEKVDPKGEPYLCIYCEDMIDPENVFRT